MLPGGALNTVPNFVSSVVIRPSLEVFAVRLSEVQQRPVGSGVVAYAANAARKDFGISTPLSAQQHGQPVCKNSVSSISRLHTGGAIGITLLSVGANVVSNKAARESASA